MKKYFILSYCLIFFSCLLVAQPRIISGPMLGPVELRDAKVWIEVSPEVNAVALQLFKKGETKMIKTIPFKGSLENDFNPITFTVGGLEVNTTYEYKFLVNGKPAS